MRMVTSGSHLLRTCRRTQEPDNCNRQNAQFFGDLSDDRCRSDDEWQARLTPKQFVVTRRAGTEPAFSGEYWNTKDDGTYYCVCCDAPLFDSTAKYDSGTGWPSFFQPLDEKALILETDTSHGMIRTEVRCRSCIAHLGHVFDDGPRPTGQRFCINSLALRMDTKREPHA